MRYSIGIDIGGTNTDIVILDEHKKIVASYKNPTTEDIITGFLTALTTIFRTTAIDPHAVEKVLLGTTHATNALLQQKELTSVGVIRIAGHNPILPPCFSWPAAMRNAVYKGTVTVPGGFECQGTEITPFSPQALVDATHKLLEQGAQSLAIIGTFSPLNNAHETAAKEIIQSIVGKEFPITISSDLGGIGFIERENVTILNSCLRLCMARSFNTIAKAMHQLNIHAPLYVTQNNGTVTTLENIIQYPVITIASGPTNSFIGGANLSQCTDAVVIDIGGTSTDVGIVLNNFPRRTIRNAHIAGIPLNLATPDVISIALGGGSYVDRATGEIGPGSSGKNVFEESCAFGGSKLTVIDIALACHTCTIEGSNLSSLPLTTNQAQSIMKTIEQTIIHLAERISGPKKLPIILVGGGASLITHAKIEKHFDIIIPPHAHVANAYGAALAEISGSVDSIVSLIDREKTLELLRTTAIKTAVARGANPTTTRIIHEEIIPFHYLPNNLARVIISAAGKNF